MVKHDFMEAARILISGSLSLGKQNLEKWPPIPIWFWCSFSHSFKDYFSLVSFAMMTLTKNRYQHKHKHNQTTHQHNEISHHTPPIRINPQTIIDAAAGLCFLVMVIIIHKASLLQQHQSSQHRWSPLL